MPTERRLCARLLALACGLLLAWTSRAEGDMSLANEASPSPLADIVIPLDDSHGARLQRGEVLFRRICSACHQPHARGVPGLFPPLAQSDYLNADHRRAMAIVSFGLRGTIRVNGETYDNVMPNLGLTEQEVADALTYVLNNFGNRGGSVSAIDVANVRAALKR